jgi:hypothetical protein
MENEPEPLDLQYYNVTNWVLSTVALLVFLGTMTAYSQKCYQRERHGNLLENS